MTATVEEKDRVLVDFEKRGRETRERWARYRIEHHDEEMEAWQKKLHKKAKEENMTSAEYFEKYYCQNNKYYVEEKNDRDS